MAWLFEQRDKCPGCGHPLAVTSDDDTRGQWTAKAVACLSCQSKAALWSQLREDNQSTDGVLVYSTREVVNPND